jgi:DNA-binding GntR family transcriptional regulator
MAAQQLKQPTVIAEPSAVPSEEISTRDRIRREVLADILHGRLPAPTEQDPLTERKLEAKYGETSRMPVRMALAVLAGEGLVRQRARHGYWLVEYDIDDVAQILAMRAGIEALIVDALSSKHVASWEDAEPESNPSEPQRAAWADALDAVNKMEKLVRTIGHVDDKKELAANFADEDTRFHASLARAADYDLASGHIGEWRGQARVYALQNGVSALESLGAINREHAALVGAIAENNGSSAVALSRTHLESALDRYRSNRRRPAHAPARRRAIATA